MITPCYPNGPIYEIPDQEIVSSSLEANTSSHPTSFLYNLSVLRDKVNQVESVASIYLSSDNSQQHPESTAALGTLIQEIMITASSMMFACQQMSLPSLPTNNSVAGGPVDPYWYGNGYNTNPSTDICNDNQFSKTELSQKSETGSPALSPKKYHIVELDAADLLAKYTHYCHVCGKGFKRDANLRMHMRAHGEEYKSSAALTNPMKNTRTEERRKYSCPQQGCRWNKDHVKFQPLKSMICAKNHYKRSHCPKMYVCKRCGMKQFSVLSDLRTHEKHCGDLKWLCSCGTTFSRKDKLMGHVALFVGHTPLLNS